MYQLSRMIFAFFILPPRAIIISKPVMVFSKNRSLPAISQTEEAIDGTVWGKNSFENQTLNDFISAPTNSKQREMIFSDRRGFVKWLTTSR